jgi:hypothetical protein
MDHAFNLARRYSQRNEHDFLQESLYDDDDDDNNNTTNSSSTNSPRSSPYSPKHCMNILDKYTSYGNGIKFTPPKLPFECEQFSEIQAAMLQRKNSNNINTNRDHHAIAFEGMHPKEASAAMAAREHGHLHHAQFQRRMTSGSNKNSRLW